MRGVHDRDRGLACGGAKVRVRRAPRHPHPAVDPRFPGHHRDGRRLERIHHGGEVRRGRGRRDDDQVLAGGVRGCDGGRRLDGDDVAEAGALQVRLDGCVARIEGRAAHDEERGAAGGQWRRRGRCRLRGHGGSAAVGPGGAADHRPGAPVNGGIDEGPALGGELRDHLFGGEQSNPPRRGRTADHPG